ncbi:MAG: T9SS type A sorting domain-containing protein [Flavobacteriales bacterium]|nr:MAG: T9SS type A sorting domain-containing protein [Flavobacteriales bacterium]
MKALLLTCALIATLTSTAQWSTDPAAPMPVCNAANAQQYMRAIADADSGYYVFWSDLRNDPQKADLYGQHFDSEGNALWTANGELLLTHPTRSFNNLAPLLMPDGSVIVSFLTRSTNIGGDTVRAMRFDNNANALWAEPTVLLTGLDFRSIQVVLSNSCAYIVCYCESCQGAYGCRMQRVRMDGSAQFPLPGQTMVSNYYGPYTIHPDGAGGLLFNIRAGNGAGTPLKAQRFDSLGTAVWPAYIDLADANGLNYAFATSMDNTLAQTAVWEVNGDLRMNRIDTLGAPVWSPTVQSACDLTTYVQGGPAALATDDALFVAWSDNRPPASNADLYLQKYDLGTGAELWSADGVLAIQITSFLPTTGLIASDSGGVVVTYEGNLDGYTAMRVRADGTLAWADPVAFCDPAFNPAYEKRVHLPDGNGGVVAFWESFAGDVYGGRIYRNGKRYNDVGIDEAASASAVRSYPNPATDMLLIDVPSGQRIVQTDVINGLGQVVAVQLQHGSMHVSGLPNGSYTARIRTTLGVLFARFVKN